VARPNILRMEADICYCFDNYVVVVLKMNSFILLSMVSTGCNMGLFVLINKMSKDVFLLLKIAARIAF
jgi:hypothetical protein